MPSSLNINGLVSLIGEKCLYHFDGSTLSIYLTNEMSLSILWTKVKEGEYALCQRKPLPVSTLTGTILGDFSQIHFFFNPVSYGYHAKGIMSEKCVLELSIPKYSISNEADTQNKKILYFHSDQFHRFLGMMPNYNAGADKDAGVLRAEVRYSVEEVALSASFAIDGRSLLLHPDYSYSWGGPTFVFKPMMALEIGGEIDDDFLWRLFFDFDELIHFAFFRTNIHVNACDFTGNKEKIDFIANWSPFEDEGPEDMRQNHHDAIPWAILYKHAGELFTSIDQKQLHLAHIGAKKTARNWMDLSTASADGAAFEQSFDALYPQGFPHSEERITAEKNVQEKIEPLEENSAGKEKDIYKGFLKHIRMEALSDKIEYALNQFAPCLDPIRRGAGLSDSTAEEIAQVCAGLRNHVDHGSTNETITQKDADCFALLRALIYALQLKKAGYDENDIKTSICFVFGVN